MELVEYLYVDEKRLDTYFEQISSPVTYDKVPEWNADISLTGPKAGGKQARFARPFTKYEKISELTKYLEDKRLVEYGRPGAEKGEGHRKMFRIEKCRAKRVFIPPDHGQPKEVGALNVWISAVPRTPEEIGVIFERGRAEVATGGRLPPGNLYLLEDAQHPDSPRYSAMSSYSVLSLIIGDLPNRRIFNRKGPARYFDNLKRGGADGSPSFNPRWVDVDAPSGFHPRLSPGMMQKVDDYASRQGWDPRETADFKQQVDQQMRFNSYFFVDPAGALAQIGAQVGPERWIRALYRVRVVFPEEELLFTFNQWEQATFGYPIFIAEDTESA